MSEGIKVGDKVRVSEDVPAMYVEGLKRKWYGTEGAYDIPDGVFVYVLRLPDRHHVPQVRQSGQAVPLRSRGALFDMPAVLPRNDCVRVDNDMKLTWYHLAKRGE